MHICPCGKEETLDEPFYAKSAVCRKCYREKKATLNRKYRKQPHTKDKYNSKARERRQDPNLRAKYILWDSQRGDKKLGRENDLTIDFINETISCECGYCGESELKMTLDRKDNSIGHIQENVIPCCVRCNYIRRDMPYEAWICLAPRLKEIRESGLFGTWTCEVHRRNVT